MDKENSNTTNSSPSSVPTPQPTPKRKPWKGEMTRAQALAVVWTGLEPLAMNGQVIIFNDRKTGRVWFGIANARVTRSQFGNAVRLVDDEPTANTANAGEVLAESEKS